MISHCARRAASLRRGNRLYLKARDGAIVLKREPGGRAAPAPGRGRSDTLATLALQILWDANRRPAAGRRAHWRAHKQTCGLGEANTG